MLGSQKRAVRLGWFLVFALLTRIHVFGDPNYQQDELLFFYIGQRMHDGLLPYVDIWDRKPPSLFLLFYLIAGISKSVLGFQLLGAVTAALTAYVIGAIADRLGHGRGGLIAGTLYLAMMLEFGGAGGQAAVFYNLPMAIAAWIVIARSDGLAKGIVPPAVPVAMALAGLAITFKQTAIFEGVFLGLFVLRTFAASGASRAGTGRLALLLTACGAAPMLAWAGFYAAAGHFGEFWHAMVTANLAKGYNPGGDLLHRARLFAVELAPVIALAVFGLLSDIRKDTTVTARAFLGGWLIAAFIGFIAIPNLIDHYVLALLVPLALATAPVLQRGAFGFAIGIGLVALYLAAAPVLDFRRGQRSADEMAALIAHIRAADRHPRPLVFDGPGYLYPLLGSHPRSPLVFPLHLSALPERNVSHLDTATEFRKLLADRPTTVIVRRYPTPPNLYNPVTHALVEAYIARNCRGRFRHLLHDIYGEMVLDVYTGCAAASGEASPR